ncbi:MAG: hypothetical protein IKF19_06805 [Bacilli bacterium]|nr:hypothetical protein [Bacilli bacterium]
MDKKNTKLIITSIIIFIIIIICLWLISKNRIEEKNINLYDVSNINDHDNPIIRDTYHQFNPEDDILFNILGSGNNKEFYAYYYKNDKVTSEELNEIIKTYLTIHSFDYKNSLVDTNKNCYQVKINDLNITYEKLFDDNKFKVSNSLNNPKIEINNDNVCIYDTITNNYIYTLDTLFVNAAFQDDELLIYERVAFIKIDENNLEFYSDYDMNNLIYKINKSDIDANFLNNPNVVSNILIKYQEKFNIYIYTFEKNNTHYVFKSVNK